MKAILDVLVQTPAHAEMGSVLSYRWHTSLPNGSLVRVPLGKREVLGIVWAGTDATADMRITKPPLDPDKLRDVIGVLAGIAPLGATWQALVTFSAQYYQRSLGEVALAALPPQLREMSPIQVERRMVRLDKATQRPTGVHNKTSSPNFEGSTPSLTPEQSQVLDAMRNHAGPFLLFGATGSGKTEVYLQSVQQVLVADPLAQALVMVPEINLTPQLEERFRARFCSTFGDAAVVSLHSGMTNPQRLNSWLAAHSGAARIVLGTRMAIFASMPHLRLIVVDEEHDPSYKSGDGARYSARDLSVYRGKLENAKVLMGSATPSLESWYHSRPALEGGRYMRLHMPSRVGTNRPMPLVRRVDMNHQARGAVFSTQLLEAIKVRVLRGEQCMLFLNRRGYAPVLHCDACGWKSACTHCSAFRVFHKLDRTLRCHHCGYTDRVPRACPDCGNLDIGSQGRGTEQIEEHITELLGHLARPNGEPIRVMRIDADSTRLKGSLQTQLAAVHAGEIDVLVGTQMIAKGHDFRRVTLVAAINPDGALFSADYRAQERLFSLLLQAAGRAGRDAAMGEQSEVWIQTFQPAHPIYAAIKAYDYPAFAHMQLKEREQGGMPPFSFQALVRAEARTQEAALAFLAAASAAAQTDSVFIYSAVPMSMQRVANVERTQMLIECSNRAVLQKFLSNWQAALHRCRSLPECKGLIRWAIDVDPILV